MRPLFLVPALALLACNSQGITRFPPANSLYFPTGLTYAPSESAPDKGVVYVASANFDRRFDYGTISAIDLSKVPGLPDFGTVAEGQGAVDLTDLALTPDQQVLIQSFAGEMAGFRVGDRLRLFNPSRGEGNYVHMVEARGAALTCTFPGSSEHDCSTGSPSTTALEKVGTGKPRAPEPNGVGISDDGQVWVTHLSGADSPVGSLKDIEAYATFFDGKDPGITADSFISLGGTGGSNSVAVGHRWAFITGRFISPKGLLVRMVDRLRTQPVLTPGLENVYQVREARGVALSSDQSRLYIAGRSPDTLLVIDVASPESDSPLLTVVRGVPLPAGANELALIERPADPARGLPARGNLVVVTSSIDSVVSVYDEDLGQFVAQLSDVGTQPYAVSVQRVGVGARIFVSTFGDGRVAVLDMPDVNAPQQTRTVARLGLQQVCLVNPADVACPQAGTSSP